MQAQNTPVSIGEAVQNLWNYLNKKTVLSTRAACIHTVLLVNTPELKTCLHSHAIVEHTHAGLK